MAEEGIEELRPAQGGVNTSRANVVSNVSTPDEELRRRFKNEIGSIRKKAEQALVGALVKYHHRRAERLRNKLRKLEQYKSRRNRNTVTKQTSHQKTQSPARKKTVNKDDNVNELAEELKTKISEVDVLLEQMRSQVCANKQSECYSCLVSDSLEVKGKGKANHRDNKAAKNRKRKERRKIEDKKRFCDAIESRKQYIKNLSNHQLTDEQITLASRGFKFIPTLVVKENLIRRQLLADFNQFARRMRLLLMGRQDKLNEGQVLLDDLNNYRPIDKPTDYE